MKKSFTLKNKAGKKIYGVMDWYGKNYGPVILVCHGYKAVLNQFQIKETAKALAREGYTAVRFDATNCPGKSDGSLVDFTVSGYVGDMKVVIDYILKKTKQKKSILFGFSIGAMAGYTLASRDKRIQALILQGPTYDYSQQYYNKIQKGFNNEGQKIIYAQSLNRNVRISNKYIKEMVNYGANKYLKKITCPILVLLGSKEEKRKHQSTRSLFKNLKSKNKKLVIIKGAHHTMRTQKEIKLFIVIFLEWLKKL